MIFFLYKLTFLLVLLDVNYQIIYMHTACLLVGVKGQFLVHILRSMFNRAGVACIRVFFMLFCQISNNRIEKQSTAEFFPIQIL